MATDRCGYTPTVRGDPDVGRVTCWRQAHEYSDRCIWHTHGGKSVAELAEYEPVEGERLDGAILCGLDLRGSELLTGTVLLGSDFSDANVTDADLSDTDLRKTTFTDATARGTDFQRANFERADVTDADLRGADLQRARLDGTSLDNSRITPNTDFGDEVVYETEMRRADDEFTRENSLETATRTYGKLEGLSQANSLTAQASHYYRKSKDVRRRFNWTEDNHVKAVVAEASRLFTGYGNRPWRVILTSLAVIVLSGLAYPLVGGLRRTAGPSGPFDDVDSLARASFGETGVLLAHSVYFSIVTFTTLGYGNLEPATVVGQYVAGAEALLGTVLLALLVGVLTRSTWLR